MKLDGYLEMASTQMLRTKMEIQQYSWLLNKVKGILNFVNMNFTYSQRPYFHIFFVINVFIGFDKIVQMLIEKNVNINAMNNNGSSPLILAAGAGKDLVVKHI